MSSSKFQPAIELPLPASLGADRSTTLDAVRDDVLQLFDECAPRLRRYVRSFGLSAEATEDVVQEVFLSLFRHLRLGRSQRNLRGWLFRVAHNLSLKQYRRHRRHGGGDAWDAAKVEHLVDPSANPEEQLAGEQRRRRLHSVLRALPERDRRCLRLRAEGLCYRDIAGTLGISLGSVAKSVARAITRLTNADME